MQERRRETSGYSPPVRGKAPDRERVGDNRLGTGMADSEICWPVQEEEQTLVRKSEEYIAKTVRAMAESLVDRG